MKSRLLLALILSLAALRAELAPSPAPTKAADPMPNMTTYYFGLITAGPKAGTGTAAERGKTQAAHLANIGRLHAAGKLLVAGPFLDGGNFRGLFIYKCATLAEAQELAATDPAVQAGRLVVEIHPRLTMKGNIHDPECPMPAEKITS